jgi:8-oxo-dGTP pyrophosphatase MutT (NUDIX family)
MALPSCESTRRTWRRYKSDNHDFTKRARMTEDPLRATVSLRGVLFAPDGDVLVVRRSSDGGWELPGGRLGAEEDAVAGVRREIEEETALDVDVGWPVHAISWRNDDDRGRFGVYYYCDAPRREVTLSHEHTDHEWLAPPAAADRLSSVQEVAVDRASEVSRP